MPYFLGVMAGDDRAGQSQKIHTQGTNDLLKQGASICTGADDVLTALEPVRPNDLAVMREAGGEAGEPLWGNKLSTGSIHNRRLERGPATNSTISVERPTEAVTKPRPRASGSSACSARPRSRSTNWLGPRRLQRELCGWRCSSSNWRGASNIRATVSPCGRRPTKLEPHRIVNRTNCSHEGIRPPPRRARRRRVRLRRRRWCGHKSRFPLWPSQGNTRAGRGGPRSPWLRAGRSYR